jgi:hypothetical protein
MNFGVTDQLLIKYSALIRYWRKTRSIMGECIRYLQNLRQSLLINHERSIVQYSH